MTGNELIVDYLTSVPAWYLATVEDTPEGAQPHVRPFSFADCKTARSSSAPPPPRTATAKCRPTPAWS